MNLERLLKCNAPETTVHIWNHASRRGLEHFKTLSLARMRRNRAATCHAAVSLGSLFFAAKCHKLGETSWRMDYMCLQNRQVYHGRGGVYAAYRAVHEKYGQSTFLFNCALQDFPKKIETQSIRVMFAGIFFPDFGQVVLYQRAGYVCRFDRPGEGTRWREKPRRRSCSSAYEQERLSLFSVPCHPSLPKAKPEEAGF